jgi:hypothetical protein
MKSIRGIFRDHADPKRIGEEKKAWKRGVREKHRDSVPESRETGQARNGPSGKLEQSANLYAEIYAENPELQELAESAMKDWPE